MMSGTPSTTPRHTIHHRRRSFVANPTLAPQPIVDDHIKFREVVDDISGEVAGKEVVYVPLQEDPNVPTTTMIVRHPLGTNETLVYQTMSLHALYLTRNSDDQRPYLAIKI